MTDTERTRAVFRWICQFKQDHDGAPPTVREICQQFGWTSSASGQYYLHLLRDTGYLYQKDGRWCVVGAEWRMAPAFAEAK